MAILKLASSPAIKKLNGLNQIHWSMWKCAIHSFVWLWVLQL